MLFHASAILHDRLGKPVREPRQGEKPQLTAGGKLLHYEDDQMCDMRHGDVALRALDTTLEGDERLMKESADKWVKAVMKRDAVSQLIAEAMQGDGWVRLKEEQKDLLYERLGLCAISLTVTVVGPVMHALDNPPEEKVEALKQRRQRQMAQRLHTKSKKALHKK